MNLLFLIALQDPNLEVKVVDPEGRPMPGVRVHLYIRENDSDAGNTRVETTSVEGTVAARIDAWVRGEKGGVDVRIREPDFLPAGCSLSHGSRRLWSVTVALKRELVVEGYVQGFELGEENMFSIRLITPRSPDSWTSHGSASFRSDGTFEFRGQDELKGKRVRIEHRGNRYEPVEADAAPKVEVRLRESSQYQRRVESQRRVHEMLDELKKSPEPLPLARKIAEEEYWHESGIVVAVLKDHADDPDARRALARLASREPKCAGCMVTPAGEAMDALVELEAHDVLDALVGGKNRRRRFETICRYLEEHPRANGHVVHALVREAISAVGEEAFTLARSWGFPDAWLKARLKERP